MVRAHLPAATKAADVLIEVVRGDAGGGADGGGGCETSRWFVELRVEAAAQDVWAQGGSSNSSNSVLRAELPGAVDDSKATAKFDGKRRQLVVRFPLGTA